MLTFIFGMVAGAFALIMAVKAELLVQKRLRQHKYDQRERVVRELRKEGWLVRPDTWK